MIDPLYHLAVRLLMIVIVGAALAHKLRDFAAFRGIVENYQILPSSFAGATAIAVIVFELSVLSLLLANILPWAGFASVALFGFYGSLIAFQIMRGRTLLDCGCSWVKGARLTPLFCVRNAMLVAASLTLIAPATSRELLIFDYGNAFCFAVVGSGAYFLSDALLHMKTLGRAS